MSSVLHTELEDTSTIDLFNANLDISPNDIIPQLPPVVATASMVEFQSETSMKIPNAMYTMWRVAVPMANMTFIPSSRKYPSNARMRTRDADRAARASTEMA